MCSFSVSVAQEVLRRVHGENFKALEGKVAIITGASNGLGYVYDKCYKLILYVYIADLASHHRNNKYFLFIM